MTGKAAKTTAVSIDLDVPRDPNNRFDSALKPMGTRRLLHFDDTIGNFNAKDMATRGIEEHLQATCGASMSHETILNITDTVNEQVKEGRNRLLDEPYPIVYVDVIRLRIRDGGAARTKACPLVVGVELNGVKRVLGICIEQDEGA